MPCGVRYSFFNHTKSMHRWHNWSQNMVDWCVPNLLGQGCIESIWQDESWHCIFNIHQHQKQTQWIAKSPLSIHSPTHIKGVQVVMVHGKLSHHNANFLGAGYPNDNQCSHQWRRGWHDDHSQFSMIHKIWFNNAFNKIVIHVCLRWGWQPKCWVMFHCQLGLLVADCKRYNVALLSKPSTQICARTLTWVAVSSSTMSCTVQTENHSARLFSKILSKCIPYPFMCACCGLRRVWNI